MWCKNCNSETTSNICPVCNKETVEEIIEDIYWCPECQTPVIQPQNTKEHLCPTCGNELSYMSTDLRPVFPEERLLFEILSDREPLSLLKESVWASTNRYYINGKASLLKSSQYKKYDANEVRKLLLDLKPQNSYEYFNKHIDNFVANNKSRLDYIKDEAYRFIKHTASSYPIENIVLSFSGGKDSTVTADLAVRALSEPSLVHIFGDTTLEFPLTIEYAKRFRENNPLAIFRIAKNREQNFLDVCKDIGPPARMMRWCCSMFKTGPITRVLNSMYKDTDILTFYGIRRSESVSRSKYNRVESGTSSVKIQKQKVASPIFFWKDIDIWLYLFGEKVDFNEAYRLGYDRVGCWCCPNNNERAQYLAKIYMPEQATQWRDFLIQFATDIGKPDPEIYVDSGKWKARQGGNGVAAANDVKIKYTNCTAEEHAVIYQLNKPVCDELINLFTPFGEIAPTLGRKLIEETIFVDIRTKVPIISIQPFNKSEFTNAVKIQTLNVENHDELQRMISYQIRKFNACRNCLKCESLCKHGAISIIGNEYKIDPKKCKRCKMCVSSKYLDAGCLMNKYLKTKE